MSLKLVSSLAGANPHSVITKELPLEEKSLWATLQLLMNLAIFKFKKKKSITRKILSYNHFPIAEVSPATPTLENKM